MRRRSLPLLLMLMLTLCTGLQAAPEGAARTEKELAALRAQIRQLEQALRRDTDRRSAAESRLREAEQAEAGARRRLDQLEQEQRAVQARQDELGRSLAAGRRALADRQQALGALLRARHVQGDRQRLRLLLSHQDPARLGRQLVHYEYLGRQQLGLMASVAGELEALTQTGAALQREAAQLAGLAQRQQAELAGLAAAREQRATLLATLAASLSDRDAELGRLNEQAQQLEQLLRRLREAVARAPVPAAGPEGGAFAGARKRIQWPARGPLLADYGKPRADGRLRWDGILVGTEPGSEVLAVYHGTLVFADWLPGLGLLAVIDHGDGYLSLYGHNQALLREVGARVAPGEVIARAGDTGGQARTSLYFAIRKDGRPVNPHDWLP